MTTLKLCPFCGSQAHYVQHDVEVCCPNPDCPISCTRMNVKSWNKRSNLTWPAGNDSRENYALKKEIKQ